MSFNADEFMKEMSERNAGNLCFDCLFRAHKEHKDSTTFVRHTNSDKLAVIIEPRFDDITEAVIFNFMYFLNPLGWNLLIVSYSHFKDEIQARHPYSLIGCIGDKHIYFDDRGIPNITIHSYNTIMMDIDFWKALPASNIIIFQRDCIMFKAFDERFLKYDYAGANYFQNLSPIYGGINGGFSFRKRDSMINCIEAVKWTDIDQYRTQRKYSAFDIYDVLSRNEDVFFTHACEILCRIVPDFFNREFFATETEITSNAAVYHGWHKNLIPDRHVKDMLRGSPLFSKYIEDS